jgi:ectoine hydroxylase-related dioxygenase (phytanoyl-CoA dioxygenase family)
VPQDGNADGYISWHRDKPPADCWPLPKNRVVKAMVYFWGVAVNEGCTALVPGSHRLSDGPRQTLGGRFTRGGQDVGGADDGDNSFDPPPAVGRELAHAAMPNHARRLRRAGVHRGALRHLNLAHQPAQHFRR